jgi:para-aminobenzoate synthetase / 4-amino-4-deoxychorismate lyase
VRIALRRNGDWDISVGPSVIAGDEITAALARRPVQRRDPNLFVKTSSRAVLDAHLDEFPEFDEVLLYNEDGLLTEFCRGNVILSLDGILQTPYPEAGCLAGIGIQAMIDAGTVQYADITVADLHRASEILFINSVTGPVRVSLDTADRSRP